MPKQGGDVTLLHDAVKATFAAGMSTALGVVGVPFQSYNAAKVACIIVDGALKLSVSPRFWLTVGSTGGRLLLACPGIVWDVTAWGCGKTTLKTALKVGLCGFTAAQIWQSNGNLAAGGIFLLSQITELSEASAKAGAFSGRLLTCVLADACICSNIQ